MRDVCTDFGCVLAEFNSEPEHVHLPTNFSPKVALSRLLTSLKGCPPGGCSRSSPRWRGTTSG